MLTQLKEQFEAVFKKESENYYFSPGRINLIGEHTDYNGGNVFPAAITIGTYGLVSKREDKSFNFYSENFPNKGVISVELANLEFDEKDD
ncbi:galactokinase, partial [Salmonella enterica subsp. enterica serovar Cerro]|nr:galactokinase [Salmonella enterica subsp. enterica serovar Cerro]